MTQPRQLRCPLCQYAFFTTDPYQTLCHTCFRQTPSDRPPYGLRTCAFSECRRPPFFPTSPNQKYCCPLHRRLAENQRLSNRMREDRRRDFEDYLNLSPLPTTQSSPLAQSITEIFNKPPKPQDDPES